MPICQVIGPTCSAGFNTSSADATKVFLQALLDATEETYVLLPPEMWHPSWIGRYHEPAVKLCRALYGHPLASAFWEKHLKHRCPFPTGWFINRGVTLPL